MAADDDKTTASTASITSLDRIRARKQSEAGTEQPQAEPDPKEGPGRGGEEASNATIGVGSADKYKHRSLETRKNPGGWAASLENTLTAIYRLKVACSYDIFHDKMKVCELSLDDTVALRVRNRISETCRFEPSTQTTFDALKIRCHENAFDPVVGYLAAMQPQFDGVPRLDTWPMVYLGAEDNPLNRAIGRKMLIAAVRRARQPGCKFDHIVVLEGPQRSGKSTALKILAGAGNFKDAEIVSLNGREQQELVTGVWIYELSELAGLRKTDVERVKLFASKTDDSARPVYARSNEDRPRRCIFVGTTNDTEYLQDPTGNTRFWPVLTGTIDLAALERDRDQLWAEAALAEATGEPLIIPEELWGAAAERQNERFIGDPWDDRLEGLERLAPQIPSEIMKVGGEWRVSRNYLLTTMLNFDFKSVRGTDGRRLSASMHRLGWKGPIRLTVNGKRAHFYFKPVAPAD
jgi:predicted P-loop ATPase